MLGVQHVTILGFLGEDAKKRRGELSGSPLPFERLLAYTERRTMFSQSIQIYRATRKKHDLVFNLYMMRPVAAVVVAVCAKTKVTPNQLTLLNLFLFVVAAALFPALPTYEGGLVAVFVLEVSYCFDCADGMLARHKKIASKEGHLFDFFTDEIKAVLLAALLGVRLYRMGGLGIDLRHWEADDPKFLFAALAGAVVLSSAISLTNFLRRPEITGREQQVEAHYETVVEEKPKSLAGRAMGLVTTFLRFLNHYPSHLWIWALAGRLDVFLWVYVAINLLYLARGWLGIVVRFGRPSR
jgi:phosphatidylglycerophosphate synthase